MMYLIVCLVTVREGSTENSHTEKTIQIFLETTTLSSSTRVQNSAESQNMDHNSHFLTQDEDDEQCLHCVSSIKPICHAEETLVSKHCCSSANKSTARPSQDPSCKQKAKSNCNCQNETEAQTHNENNENSRMTQDAGTQTAAVPALSCQDVSVQCSLIYADSHSSSSFPAADQKTSVPTTRRQSFHFNGLLTPTTRSSPKDGNTRAGKILLGASATNEQAQRLPKSQIDFYFRKPQSQASMKRPPTPILGKTIIKASELKEEQQLESRMKIKRCGGPQLESVTQNSVKDVGRAEESVKEKKNFTADRGVNWVSEETKKLQEIADILLMLKQRKK
ncbi:uncharacterized protein LOC127437021 isoform X2 [Myxocyprinus asiaticus]|uniref:uncharacterized protein LOC127437021 isoform X2 n=1 Tax=Myxocyprinus asiaticus TaxID=70543 RepID=UPI0022222E53|nr:uncharacterized protein LOC127437021 isoform X2 [Myxocyprinus asiaticus]